MAKETKTKKVFVVWGNTDLTEGRGARYPKYFCSTMTTAIRLAKRGYVQGSDCPIDEIEVFLHTVLKNRPAMWYGPINIQYPTLEDIANEEKRLKKQDVLNKARMAGISEEDLKTLLS